MKHLTNLRIHVERSRGLRGFQNLRKSQDCELNKELIVSTLFDNPRGGKYQKLNHQLF